MQQLRTAVPCCVETLVGLLPEHLVPGPHDRTAAARRPTRAARAGLALRDRAGRSVRGAPPGGGALPRLPVVTVGAALGGRSVVDGAPGQDVGLVWFKGQNMLGIRGGAGALHFGARGGPRGGVGARGTHGRLLLVGRRQEGLTGARVGTDLAAGLRE